MDLDMETGGEDDTGDMVSRKDQCETTVVENRLLEIDKVNAEVLVDMEGTEKQVTQVAEDTANVEEVSTDKINLSRQKTTQFDPGQLTLHIPTAGQVIQLPAGLRVSRTPDKRLVIFKHPPGHQADVQGASRAPPYGQRIGGQRTGSMVPPATASKACRQIVLTTQQPIGENPIIPSTNDTQDDDQLHSQGHRLSSRAGTFPGIQVVSLASLQSEPNTQDLPQLLGAQNIPIVNDTATGFETQHIMIEHESNTSNNVAVRHLRNIDGAQNISRNLNNLTAHDHANQPPTIGTAPQHTLAILSSTANLVNQCTNVEFTNTNPARNNAVLLNTETNMHSILDGSKEGQGIVQLGANADQQTNLNDEQMNTGDPSGNSSCKFEDDIKPDLNVIKNQQSNITKYDIDMHGYVNIYAKGICVDLGTEYAQAYAGVFWGTDSVFNSMKKVMGGLPHSNGFAAIHAAIIGVKKARKLKIKKLNIITDSEYVINR